MSYCPSQDLDCYIDKQDAAAAAAAAFWKENRKEIIHVASSLVGKLLPVNPDEIDIEKLVRVAGLIVEGIYFRGEYPE